MWLTLGQANDWQYEATSVHSKHLYNSAVIAGNMKRSPEPVGICIFTASDFVVRLCFYMSLTSLG